MSISVIIPTYNRPNSVVHLLQSLDEQSDLEFEVVVVDDGSHMPLQLDPGMTFRYPLRVLRQGNQGATAARNFGVLRTTGEIIVFIDDDVTLQPGALAALVAGLTPTGTIAQGQLLTRAPEGAGVYAFVVCERKRPLADQDSDLPFAQCNTEFLAVTRGDFMELGMLQDPTGGWPNWDDVDFGYRAHSAGFRLRRIAAAIAHHWDGSLRDRHAANERWYRAARSAPRLFARHPDLAAHLPMFADKTPLDWTSDGPGLKLRKGFRRLSATAPAVATMEGLTTLVEATFPRPGVLRPLYRWLTGSYLSKGYRDGIREIEETDQGRAQVSV